MDASSGPPLPAYVEFPTRFRAMTTRSKTVCSACRNPAIAMLSACRDPSCSRPTVCLRCPWGSLTRSHGRRANVACRKDATTGDDQMTGGSRHGSALGRAGG